MKPHRRRKWAGVGREGEGGRRNEVGVREGEDQSGREKAFRKGLAAEFLPSASCCASDIGSNSFPTTDLTPTPSGPFICCSTSPRPCTNPGGPAAQPRPSRREDTTRFPFRLGAPSAIFEPSESPLFKFLCCRKQSGSGVWRP